MRRSILRPVRHWRAPFPRVRLRVQPLFPAVLHQLSETVVKVGGRIHVVARNPARRTGDRVPCRRVNRLTLLPVLISGRPDPCTIVLLSLWSRCASRLRVVYLCAIIGSLLFVRAVVGVVITPPGTLTISWLSGGGGDGKMFHLRWSSPTSIFHIRVVTDDPHHPRIADLQFSQSSGSSSAMSRQMVGDALSRPHPGRLCR